MLRFPLRFLKCRPQHLSWYSRPKRHRTIPLERVATVNVFLTVGFSHAITPIMVISAVATMIQQSFDIQGKTHGQGSTVRGYHPANIGHLDV